MRNLTVEQQYSPNLGSISVLDGFTTDINAPYTFSSSLPTQVFKVYAKNNATTNYSRIIGEKSYELNDHLGNFNDTWVLSSKTLSGINPVRNLSEATGIRVVISDRKYLADRDDNNTISTGDNFVTEVLSANEYGAFGSILPGRSFAGGGYRYGFNGHEKDDEVKGSGNHVSWGDYGMDPRIGRRWNTDPQAYRLPGQSPYSVNNNNPIQYTDPDGEFGIIGAIIGGVVGGIAELGSQVVGNIVQGQPAFKSIDWGDVIISAGQGAVLVATGGSAWWVALAFEGAKSGVDVTHDSKEGWKKESVGGFIGDKKDPTQALIDLGSGLAGRGLAKSVGKLGKKAASKVSGAISNGDLLTDGKLVQAATAGALTQEGITGTASGLGVGLTKSFFETLSNATLLENYTSSPISEIQHNVSFELVIPEKPKMGPVYIEETPKSINTPSSNNKGSSQQLDGRYTPVKLKLLDE
jgi:hypothetical protein